MTTIDRAYELASTGRTLDAARLLQAAGQAGDPLCWVELATWFLSGQYLTRDLRQSREAFRRAANLGHGRSRVIYLSLLAAGVGGPADWHTAIRLLGELAPQYPDAARQLELLGAMSLDSNGNPREVAAVDQLSETPWVRVARRAFSERECTYLVEQARPLLQPSVIVDPTTGRMRQDPVRSSDNAAFPWVDETPFIHAINRRIAALSGTAVEAGEPLQILRYQGAQQYKPHHDAIAAADNQRIKTAIIYLNEGYRGGETHFLRNDLKFTGHQGDLLIFSNVDAQGRPDPAAVHAGLPVTSGEKLIATRWIHERRFGPL